LLLHAARGQPPHRRAQLQILVVRSLEGENIEGFAVRVFEQWKLGEKDKDNGVLIVVSKEDRRMRIETGYGGQGVAATRETREGKRPPPAVVLVAPLVPLSVMSTPSAVAPETAPEMLKVGGCSHHRHRSLHHTRR
jgi:TPM domain